jgi:hypothetical protein
VPTNASFLNRIECHFRALRHRGQGGAQPGRSAKGLLRATVLALRVIKDDQDLQGAIRDEPTAHRRKVRPAGPSVAATSTSLKAKIDKLLGLYYAGKISDDTFATEVWEEATTEERRTLIDDLWLPAA